MKKSLGKWVLAVGFVAVVVLFKRFNLGEYLTLESLKTHKDFLDQTVSEKPVFTALLYFGTYLLVTAASLPGAAILTLAGGALFGVFYGTLIVSFASTLGATCAFLLARYLFREAVTKKFRSTIEKIDNEIEKQGPFYLFSLRLIPIFPFFVINLALGLTRMKTLTFFWVSQVGMLLGTIAFVNAGTQLSRITSLKGILSPSLVFSFAFLGILPFIAKKVVQAIQSRKTLGRYKKPKKYDYNLVVIGGGSAGLVSSYIAAAVKAKVVLIEKHKMGGDCLNTGCVPSKALIRSAKVLKEQRRAKDLGFDSIEAKFDFGRIMDRVQEVIRKIEPHDSVDRYSKLGVECISGNAKIKSPYEVEVNGKILTTKNIIVATGARPLVPNIPGLDQVKYLTSDNLWSLRSLPKRLVVLGGGAIGCELAQCFTRFGSQVTQVERGNRIMGREDQDVSELITQTFKTEGIDVRTGHAAKAIKVENGNKFLICDHAGKEVEIAFDEIILALGRAANVKGFGLEELGVQISERGTIQADETMRTNFPNIFVCGDVTGPFQFTHTASHQAWYASVNALFTPLKQFKVDYRVIPWSTFTDPEVARVGFSEEEATKKGIPFEVTTYGIDDLDRAIADSEDHGFVKVLTEKGKDKIIGVTIVGAHAGDIIVEYVTAMKHGIGLNKILGTIHIYPTFGEANKYAAGNWKRAHAPEKVLNYLKKIHAWRRG